MSTITIKQQTSLKSLYETQQDLVDDILENLGYFTLWQVEPQSMPEGVRECYAEYKKSPPTKEELLNL